MDEAAILQVAVDAPLRTALDYLPPPNVSAVAVPLGARVRVPIGRRRTVGVAVARSAASAIPAAQLKPALELLDAEPLLDTELLRLLTWTADYYHHPIGEVIAAALPKPLRAGAEAAASSQYLRLTATGRAAPAAALRGTRQRQLLGLLDAAAGAPVSELALALSSWSAVARPLVERGWVERYRGAPPAEAAESHTPESALALAAEQAEAVAAIDAAAGHYQAFALLGATGSGKTEVYLQCSAQVLARGQSVLMLVPEIGLTPQLVARVRARFGVPVAVLHSGLGEAERLRAWRAARAGEARIVLGTRSAVFAPLAALGLIIVDEEHDSSYKQQEGGCRYSARDLAVVRAQQQAVPVVLGSATPALETLHNVEQARYRLLRLPRRTDQAPPPRLALIDLRQHAVQAGLAAPVVRAMQQHLAARGQVLVFINRRGYAPTLLCTGCGWIAPCPECDARLTVHRAAARLRCHHCGAEQDLPQRCPRCGHVVKAVGQGTERVEETLQALFPHEPLVRLDRDTTRSPAAHEAVVQAVLSGEARVLVGTQMVTKGHHFPDVTLVVVLNADQGLFSIDFRAAERLAQTIVQVAGRAGRAARQGEVLIQTEYPEHPMLKCLLDGGYETFAASALAERASAHWPPFSRLALLRASSRSADGALEFLSAARACAPPMRAVRVLGPVAAAMTRRAGRYHAQLLLESAERTALHRCIEQWLPHIDALPSARRVRWALDVDPLDVH